MKLKNILLIIPLVLFYGFAQGQATISGTVTDSETGEPLIGANVIFVGTGIGTATDIDGNYFLEVPDGANAIEISYAGYQPAVFVLDARSVIDASLTDGEPIEEVSVIR